MNHFKSMGLYGVGKIVLALDFVRLSFLLKSADALVAVSKGYLNWGLGKIGKPITVADRVFYLGYKNAIPRNLIKEDESSDLPDWLNTKKAQKLFIFIGTFGVSYELELILEAAKRFKNSGRTDICFILAGAGEKSEMIVRNASGMNNIVLPGWIGKKEIDTLLKMGFAGLVPCRSVENTMPNKPFEYLSAGLPLLNSLEGEMAELIDQLRFGLNYLPGDLDGLCQCIERLADDTKLHDEMSKNAIDFFRRYGDADKIYDEYAEHIEWVVEKWSNKISRL